MDITNAQHVHGALEVNRLAAHDGLDQLPGALEHDLFDKLQRHVLGERRHEFPGDLFFHTLDGVRSRRIHYVEVTQDLERIVIKQQVLADRFGSARLAVAQNRDRTRGGQISHREDLVAKQRVDERALAAVVLADDNQQKELVHLVDERGQSLEIRARSVGLRQCIADA